MHNEVAISIVLKSEGNGVPELYDLTCNICSGVSGLTCVTQCAT